jgi:hypothetical protein
MGAFLSKAVKSSTQSLGTPKESPELQEDPGNHKSILIDPLSTLSLIKATAKVA